MTSHQKYPTVFKCNTCVCQLLVTRVSLTHLLQALFSSSVNLVADSREKYHFLFKGHYVALRLFFHTYVATRLTGPSCDLVCPTSPAQYLNVTNCPPSNDNSPVLLRGIARVAIIITTTIYDSEDTAIRSAILPATMQHTVTEEAIDYMKRDLYNQYSNYISIRRFTRRVL